MKIELDDQRRAEVIARLRALFDEEFDEPLSEFQANRVLELFMTTLCPAVYNQAVQDVRAHLQTKLDDLDGDIYADSDI
ncbi:MAG: DUF2164 domain-containing protein [Rhodomicrobiaceae bacterium]